MKTYEVRLLDGKIEESKYLKPQRLEAQIRLAAYSARTSMFDTKRGLQLETRWNKLMIELRGWGTYEPDYKKDVAKPSWLEYCKKEGLVYDYTISDVMA